MLFINPLSPILVNNSDLIFITVIMRHIFSPWRQDGLADILVRPSVT